MSVFSILLCIQYFSIVLMIFLCAYIIKKWSKPAHGWFFFYCITTLVNNAGYLALMNAQTEREALLIWQYTYICRAWIPFTLLKFGLFLCTGKRYPKLTTFLSHVHVLMYLLVLTMNYNSLYYTSYQFVQDGFFPHLVLKRGPVHFVYDAMCFCYAVVVIKLMIGCAIKEKDACKRRQFIITSIAIISVVVFWVCNVLRLIPCYDMTSLGFTVGAVVFYIGIFCFDILDTKNMTEAVVFNGVLPQADAKSEEAGEKSAVAGDEVQPAQTKAVKPKIEAFGDYDMRVKLPLSEILYFEADAEQVFAYTKDEIYNVKLRLYQVEEIAHEAGIIRVSKSHLINLKKIEAVRPALNSRLYVKMLNGEEVLVSRKYAHLLKEAIA